MGEDFSPTLLSYETHSPTRRAGWGLNPGFGTVELDTWAVFYSYGMTDGFIRKNIWEERE